MSNNQQHNQYKRSWLGVLFISISSVFLSGCIRKLDVNLPQGSMQLVVNAHLTNDDVLPIDTTNTYNTTVTTNQQNVQLSRTADPLDPQPQRISDRNAIVQITENGAVVATGIYSPFNIRNTNSTNNVITYDLGAFKPQPNKTYTLRVKTQGFETSIATTTTTAEMQDFTAVHTIDSTTLNNGQGGNGPNIRNDINKITIQFKDDANTTDFYEVKVWSLTMLDQDGNGVSDTIRQQRGMYSNNGVAERSYSGSVLLTDNIFNGQNFSLELGSYSSYNSGYNDPVTGQYIYVSPFSWQARVYKITKEQYLYQKSILKQAETSSNPFAEPSFIYSNMSNGFGIFSLGLGKTVQAVMR